MRHVKWATAISIVLCLPMLLAFISAMLNYEPPFVQQYLTDPATDTPNLSGRIVMLGMLCGVPAAFVINLLPMLRKAESEPAAPFNPTVRHAIAGLSVLLVVQITFAQPVLNELRPFMRSLGSLAVVGQGLCFLVLLPLPAAFLLNRLPRLTRAGSQGALIVQPISLNLIVGGAILLIIIMLASTFMLEEIACQIGVPNCD